MTALSLTLLFALFFILGWLFSWVSLAYKIVTASKFEFDKFISGITNTRNEHPELWDKE